MGVGVLNLLSYFPDDSDEDDAEEVWNEDDPTKDLAPKELDLESLHQHQIHSLLT